MRGELVRLVIAVCVSITTQEETSMDTQLMIRVSQVVPRHQCRRALRNIQEFVVASSVHLHRVSSGCDGWKSVLVELPPSWRATECSQDLTILEGRLAREDVLVRGSHPVYGDTPHSTQFGGCSQSGLTLEIPFTVFTDHSEVSSSDLESSLVALTQWRYGVFPEVGIPGDIMYPANITEGTNTRSNTGCESSQLKEGEGLCPLSPSYDSTAATKQNLLCSGLSARQTILSKFSSVPSKDYVPPSVRYVMPLDTERVVLVLETSPHMTPMWKSVLAATFHYIHSLSEGTELAVLSYNSEVSVHLEPTRVEGGNREGLHYRIPRRLSHKEGEHDNIVCLHCALETARQLSTNTSTIVLVSSSLYFSDKNQEKLLKLSLVANPILHCLILAPTSNTTQHNTCQQLFLINDQQSILNISSQLGLALASLSSHGSEEKFHKEELCVQNTEGSFSVEPSLSSDLWLQLLTSDTRDISVFEVRSPSGQVFAFPKYDAGLVYFSLRGPRETGVWTYRVIFYSSSVEPSPSKTFLLECWASGSLAPPRLTGWTSTPREHSSPVIVYAKLEADGVPISGATVEAAIILPGSLTSVIVTLEDSGSGYPDITLGDGVYSGYFTKIAPIPGIYSVTLTASNNSTATIVNTRKVSQSYLHQCCGSSLPTQPSIPLQSFTRFTASPSFTMSWGSGSVQSRDVFPPRRITDFRLGDYFDKSLFVTLVWTSPGDDYSQGVASRYEIRCFTAKDALSEENFGEQGILVHSSLVPVPELAGKKQRCTVGVPWASEVFYYAIVAFDEAGNRGEVSNTLAVYVEEPVTTLIPEQVTSTAKYLEMKDVSKTLPLKSFIHSESLMYVIAGVISFILIVTVIILTVIIRRLGVCKQKSSVLTNSAPSSQPPSLPDLCHPGLETESLPYTRHSVSYMSGYDLPEMLEYTVLQGGNKVSLPQSHYLPSGHHLMETKYQSCLPTDPQYQSKHSKESQNESQYLREVQCQNQHLTKAQYQGQNIPEYQYQRQNLTEIQYQNKHLTESKYQSQNLREVQYKDNHMGESQYQSQQMSPSVSPANSTFTGGQSTDCSVSVSGSDHELVTGDCTGLQVVSVTDDLPIIQVIPPLRPEPRQKKVPPAVPCKTVHASLV